MLKELLCTICSRLKKTRTRRTRLIKIKTQDLGSLHFLPIRNIRAIAPGLLFRDIRNRLHWALEICSQHNVSFTDAVWTVFSFAPKQWECKWVFCSMIVLWILQGSLAELHNTAASIIKSGDNWTISETVFWIQTCLRCLLSVVNKQSYCLTPVGFPLTVHRLTLRSFGIYLLMVYTPLELWQDVLNCQFTISHCLAVTYSPVLQ